MKILVLIAFALIFTTTIFADQTNKWEGIYTFNEESWDESHVRSYRWFRLEVKKTDAKTLFATYSDGENARTYRKFGLKAIPTKDSIKFYFETDLTYIDIACSEESSWKKGEKFLELRERQKDGKSFIQTIWGKENLGLQSETGRLRKDNIFFRKVG